RNLSPAVLHLRCCPLSLQPTFVRSALSHVFFLHAPPTTGFSALSLHDALPICELARGIHPAVLTEYGLEPAIEALATRTIAGSRSEEHTSELQSLTNLVCRLLLGKKKIMPAI